MFIFWISHWYLDVANAMPNPFSLAFVVVFADSATLFVDLQWLLLKKITTFAARLAA